MKRTLTLLVALVVPTLAACPDRKEAIDTVGGMPAQQVDIARKRIEAAEAKMIKQNAAIDDATAPR